MTLSIISSAVGTIPAAMIAETASDALSTSSNVASHTRTASGARIKRTHADVTMPSVPSLPTNAAVKSYPGRSIDVCKHLAALVDDFESEHVIDRRAVRETVRTAGVGCDVAADRRNLLRRRIGRIEQPVRCRRREKIRLMTPGCTRARVLTSAFELQNAVHARERDDDAAFDRDRAAAEPRARAAWHDRLVILGRDLDDGRNVGRETGSTTARRATVRVRVKRVNLEVLGLGFHGIRAERVNQPLEHCGVFGGAGSGACPP